MLKAVRIGTVELKPSHSQELHGALFASCVRCTDTSVAHLGMKDTDDPSVHERMVAGGVRSEEHDVGMAARVNRVLIAAHVVSRVVDSDDLMLIHTAVDDVEAVVLLRRECVRPVVVVRVAWMLARPENPSQEVVVE